MKNNMSLIMESWRTSLEEQEEQRPQVTTVGELRKAVATAITIMRNPKAKEQLSNSVKGLAISILKDAIPGANTIGQAIEAGLGLYGVLKSVYSMDDSKNISPGLKSLNIDDELSAVVDDKVELQFLKYLTKELERMPDDAKIASLDMNELLSNFIKQNYDNTTVKK